MDDAEREQSGSQDSEGGSNAADSAAKRRGRREPPAPPDAPDAAESKPAADEERYTSAGWRERLRQLGRPSPHALAGALHDTPADRELSEAEVRDALEGFAKRQTGGGEG